MLKGKNLKLKNQVIIWKCAILIYVCVCILICYYIHLKLHLDITLNLIYEEFQKAKFKTSTSFSIFHLNIYSVQLDIEELRILLEILNFDIIAISETKLKDIPIVGINLNGLHPIVKIWKLIKEEHYYM